MHVSSVVAWGRLSSRAAPNCGMFVFYQWPCWWERALDGEGDILHNQLQCCYTWQYCLNENASSYMFMDVFPSFECSPKKCIALLMTM